MKKVLIVTYYWPPSGGAGVQRWVKLSKYLARNGVKTFVLSVNEQVASYMQLDESLVNEISPEVTVLKTHSFEPLRYYAQLVGKKNVPTAGFSNIDNEKLLQKIVTGLRSNLFIPDPRKGWNRYAIKKATKIIENEGIDTLISSSPPHSTQLIGLKLKEKFPQLNWIADLRDPWTDIYYYNILRHTSWSKKIDAGLEKKVFIHADKMLTVSKSLKKLFASKSELIDLEKIHVIPNGFDEEDFISTEEVFSPEFVISYIGTMADTYQPEAFFEAVRRFTEAMPELTVKLRFVGIISPHIETFIAEAGLSHLLERLPYVPHHEAIRYMRNSTALLLIIPKTKDEDGILTGKLFEYMASRRTILCVGPPGGDAAAIIEECKSGKTFDRSEVDGIVEFLKEIALDFKENPAKESGNERVKRYSRNQQALSILNL